MKVNVTGPDGSPKATAYTVDDIIFEKNLSFLYGLALSACNSDKVERSVDEAFRFLLLYMYRR